jgi:hypothetical protein
MGNFTNTVESFNNNGIHFFDGSIVFEPGDGNYDSGDVTVFGIGQQGSFWYSATNNQLYVSRTTGATTSLGLSGPL